MKKAFLVVLALVMCITLCACGGDKGGNAVDTTNNDEQTSAVETGEPTPEEPKVTEIYLNESVKLGDFELTVTFLRFVDKYTTSGTVYSTGDGYKYLQVDYLVKNVSKTDKLTPLGNIKVDYNDGYIFEHFKTYREVAMYDGGVVDFGEMPPLSSAVDCRTYISVPEEVYTSENPLKLTVALSDGEGLANGEMNLRPLSEKQKDAFYNTATELIDTATDYTNYCYATYLFEMIGEYKDSEALKENAYLHWYGMTYSAGSNDRLEFFTQRINNFRNLSGAEISSLFGGEYWDFNGISGEILIYANGKIDDGWGNDRSWRVEGDKLLWILRGKVINTYEVRFLFDGAYMLVENGKPANTLVKIG